MKPVPDDEPKRFHIQRRRLGEIKFLRPDGDFGFIEAEDFREDVFFHKSVWHGELNGRRRELKVGIYVEFEIDEDYRAKEKKLRAKIVKPTMRPMGKRLSGRDTPHLVNKHHPKARQKRPTWRGGDGPVPPQPESPTP